MTVNYEKIVHFLRNVPAPAADQAMGFALLEERGERVGVLSQALLDRGSDEAVCYLVRMFHLIDPRIRQSLVDRCPGISVALRKVSRDTDVQSRRNVVDLISASSHPKLAYLFSCMLHDESPSLRALSADGYKKMSRAAWLNYQRQNPTTETGTTSIQTKSVSTDLQHFFQNLETSLDTFASHLRTEIIESAMVWGDLLPERLWEKFTSDRSRAGRVAVEILTRESNPDYAGFAFRSLTSVELGKHLARIIAAERSSDFMRRWLAYSWYRFDLNVQKNLARINKPFRWLAETLDPLLESPCELQISFVDLLMLTSISSQDKLSFLGGLLAGAESDVQEHVVSTLIDSELPGASELLIRAVSFEQNIRFSPRAARMAGQYLEKVKQAPKISADARETVQKFQPGVEQYFDQLWLTFEQLEPGTVQIAVERLRGLDPRMADHIRQKLKSGEPSDRCRAILLIRYGMLSCEFADDIYPLCRDVDPKVRASAIRMLADIPNATAEQTLIEALDDDDSRVQANAIEALEAINPPNLLHIIEPKLTSANNRIRANAIKAILKPQYMMALHVLSTMLDHPDPVFRRSALWAVKKTIPIQLGEKINKLAQEDPDSTVRADAIKTLHYLLSHWKKSSSPSKGEPSVEVQS